jgi:hypothetical protein
MKKAIFLSILFCVFNVFAINPFSWFWNIKLTGDTATVTKWKKNNDSVRVWAIAISDTVTNQIPRWKGLLRNHDSTFNWMNIDTIKGPVLIDSLAGNLFSNGDFTINKSSGASVLTCKSIDAASLGEIVVGSDSANISLYAAGTTNPNYAKSCLLYTNTKTDKLIISTGKKAPITFCTPNYLTEIMRVDSSGNVGIGTVYPKSKFTVKGNILDSGNTTITGGDLFVTGKSTYSTQDTVLNVKDGSNGTFLSAVQWGDGNDFYFNTYASGSFTVAGNSINASLNGNVTGNLSGKITVGGGSTIDSIAMVDGASDTLKIKIGSKVWAFLPVANK